MRYQQSSREESEKVRAKLRDPKPKHDQEFAWLKPYGTRQERNKPGWPADSPEKPKKPNSFAVYCGILTRSCLQHAELWYPSLVGNPSLPNWWLAGAATFRYGLLLALLAMSYLQPRTANLDERNQFCQVQRDPRLGTRMRHPIGCAIGWLCGTCLFANHAVQRTRQLIAVRPGFQMNQTISQRRITATYGW